MGNNFSRYVIVLHEKIVSKNTMEYFILVNALSSNQFIHCFQGVDPINKVL